MSKNPFAYAQISARQAAIVDGIRFEEGDIYGVIKLPIELLKHFKRSLRWSSFNIVELSEKDAGGNGIASKQVKTAVAAIEKDLNKIADMQTALEAAEAERDQLRADLKALRKFDYAEKLATADVSALGFIDKDIAAQSIKGARKELKRREDENKAKAAADAKKNSPDQGEARAESIADLQEVDGIGPQKAEILIDEFKILNRNAFREYLETDEGPQILIDHKELRASEDMVRIWFNQLQTEKLAAEVDSVYLAECFDENDTPLEEPIYLDENGGQTSDVHSAHGFDAPEDCQAFINETLAGKNEINFYKPALHSFTDLPSEDTSSKNKGAE